MKQPDPDTQFDAATAAHIAGRLNDAEALYRKVLAIRPEHGGALHGLGLLAAQTGDLHRAEATLARAAMLEPDRAEWIYHLALVALGLKKPHEASAALRRVVELEPQFPDGHNTLGVALKQMGDVDGAI